MNRGITTPKTPEFTNAAFGLVIVSNGKPQLLAMLEMGITTDQTMAYGTSIPATQWGTEICIFTAENLENLIE